MAQAKRDQNSITTLLGVSNADSETPVVIEADPTTKRLLVDTIVSSITTVTTLVGITNTVEVAILDAAGNQITSFGGGTQYTEGDVDATITGTAVLWEDTSDTLRVASVAKPLPVQLIGSTSTVSGVNSTVEVNAAQKGTWNIGTLTGITNTVTIQDNGGSISIDDNGGSITVDGALTIDSLSTVTVVSAVTNITNTVTVSGVKGGGTELGALRVTLANDSTGLLSVDDNGGSLTIDGTLTGITNTVSIQDNGGSISVDDNGGSLTIDGTLAGITNTVSIQDNGGSISVDDNGGTLTVDGTITGVTNTVTISGVTGGGTELGVLRVTLANDSTGLISIDDNGGSLTIDGTLTGITNTVTVESAQKGTWTIQPGNTANTTPWLVSQTPATSGGLSTYRVISANTTADALIKATAGQVYAWVITNVNASARTVKLYNSTSTPTSGGTTPLVTLVIPGNSSANSQAGGETFATASGITFSNGIGIGIVTGSADSATGAVATGDVVCNVFYK